VDQQHAVRIKRGTVIDCVIAHGVNDCRSVLSAIGRRTLNRKRAVGASLGDHDATRADARMGSSFGVRIDDADALNVVVRVSSVRKATRYERSVRTALSNTAAGYTHALHLSQELP
jgi:hypothetical protein